MNIFKIIGFTDPYPSFSAREEARKISILLNSGAIDFIHFRKKFSPKDYARHLLDFIPDSLHQRLVLHSHYDLISDYAFGGFHLSKDSTVFPDGFGGFFTRGCHSIEELNTQPSVPVAYSFLSPIFDSISKKGYRSAFSLDDVSLARTLNSQRVIALGGVTPDFFEILYRSKFAGAALLGYLWSRDFSLNRFLTARQTLTD